MPGPTPITPIQAPAAGREDTGPGPTRPVDSVASAGHHTAGNVITMAFTIDHATPDA